jgi:hypothetical protein
MNGEALPELGGRFCAEGIGQGFVAMNVQVIPVGSRTGAIGPRSGLSVAPRFRWECLTSRTVNGIPVPRRKGQADKRYVLFNIGHVPLQLHEMKETLDWFDRYLGPVTMRR